MWTGGVRTTIGASRNVSVFQGTSTGATVCVCPSLEKRIEKIGFDIIPLVVHMTCCAELELVEPKQSHKR